MDGARACKVDCTYMIQIRVLYRDECTHVDCVQLRRRADGKAVRGHLQRARYSDSTYTGYKKESNGCRVQC